MRPLIKKEKKNTIGKWEWVMESQNKFTKMHFFFFLASIGAFHGTTIKTPISTKF
jgi:hypothetical protein